MNVGITDEAWRQLVQGHMARQRIEQKELARRLDKSRAYVSRLISGAGRSHRSVNELIALCKELNLNAVDQVKLLLAAAGLEEDEAITAYRKLLNDGHYLENARSFKEEK